jgi:hypothetical protein
MVITSFGFHDLFKFFYKKILYKNQGAARPVAVVAFQPDVARPTDGGSI